MKASEYLSHLAYDSVVFGYHDGNLKILIMEYHNTGFFALPGGFVRVEEDLDHAVRRGLKERTGLDQIFLEQFHAFGNRARFQPDVMRTILEANGHSPAGDYAWILDRFISVAYYALIDYRYVTPQPDALSDSCAWYAVNQLPPLILDHTEIVTTALTTLRNNLDRKLQQGHLLPEKFTMNDLQRVYEAILGTPLRRTSFQRRILSLDIVERHEKQYTGKAHKAPYLYSFKKANL